MEKSLSDQFLAAGRAVSDLGLGFTDQDRFGIEFAGLSVKPPKVERGEFLLVLRAYDQEGGPIVSFTSATTLEECFRSAVARIRNGSMKWRADEYAGR